MRTRLVGLLLFLVAAFIFGGVFEAQSAVTKEDQEGYKKQVEEKLKTIGDQIKDLKKKGVEVKDEAKAEYKKEMNELKIKEEAAKKKLKELKKASLRVWDKVKSEMDESVASLEKTYDRVADRFRKR